LEAAPVIFAPLTQRLRLRSRDRLWAGLISAGCLAVLLAAAYLEPDPAGVGTTSRLGLGECGFLQNTGLPCAACGMTTSFNHFVRLEWMKSVWTQPMGFALAVATCATFWASLYIAATGRPAHRLLRRLPGVKLLVGAVALGILAWGFKMALTLGGIAHTHW
jgi:hypothetical protein